MSIEISNYLDKDCIVLGLKHRDKKKVLSGIVDYLIEKKKIGKEDKREILKKLIQREEMGSTAIGGGIALPHARVKSVKNIVICLAISNEGIDFNSLDEQPVSVITLLLSNQNEAGLHLKTLAFLARMLRDKYFIQQLKKAKTEEDILALVNKQQQAIL